MSESREIQERVAPKLLQTLMALYGLGAVFFAFSSGWCTWHGKTGMDYVVATWFGFIALVVCRDMIMLMNRINRIGAWNYVFGGVHR